MATPSRTSSGSLTPLTLHVATARSKCTNIRAATVVPNGNSNPFLSGTHESLARSSFRCTSTQFFHTSQLDSSEYRQY
ncbi:hypothetical protein T03_17054 [Trichinella britovi]|uniref:Uncharacterized protein n=1 Tax=Trichinella britovi TaxID=45882 RepID=A0A0V1D2S3_TRIBR|nr:hypothetical protein T03_17054 [Trichinella britovi]